MVECGYCLACCFLEIAGDENNESKNCSFSFQGAMRAMKKILPDFFFFLSKNNVPVGHGFRVWACLGGTRCDIYYYLVHR